MSRVLLAPVLAALALLGPLASPASAQSLALEAYGVRGGLSLDDDLTQLLVGLHADFGGLDAPIRLRPLISVGADDDALSVLAGGEVHWWIPIDTEARFDPYLGGGVGIFHVDPDEGDGETDAALLITAGADVPVQRWWGWFAEGKFVIYDDVVFRLEGGVNWTY
ncbi:MAG TPA: hypothetical protein VM778_02695 [Gemmatimonadota bacterium]|nr:hypothetical protein [Gemmatimonadota bacterium]